MPRSWYSLHCHHTTMTTSTSKNNNRHNNNKARLKQRLNFLRYELIINAFQLSRKFLVIFLWIDFSWMRFFFLLKNSKKLLKFWFKKMSWFFLKSRREVNDIILFMNPQFNEKVITKGCSTNPIYLFKSVNSERELSSRRCFLVEETLLRFTEMTSTKGRNLHMENFKKSSLSE